MHVIFLITGLASSLPLIGRIFTWWARQLESRLKDKYGHRDDVLIMRVSADLKGEEPVLLTLLELIRKQKIKTICGAGHSNGFRDGITITEKLFPYPVDYFAGIDMTLGELGAEAQSNILKVDEFRAQFGTRESLDFVENFPEGRHKEYWIPKGHTATANDAGVRAKIFQRICNEIDSYDKTA